MAALPFHYYLALREDWIKTNTVHEDIEVGEAVSPVEDVLGTYNAQSLVGEMV